MLSGSLREASYPVEVMDVTGAGDAFLAAALAHLSEEVSLDQ